MNHKRNQDTRKARTRFFIAFLAVCAVMILADKARAQQPHWTQSPTITYEAESVTGPVQIAVEYAAWSLSQRTGLDIQPAGFGPAGVNGTIHVRVVNALEAFEAGVGFSAVGYVIPWTYTATGEIARAEFNILENEADELTDMLVRIAVHEMGHAVGIRGHSADTRDVMFAVIGPDYRYTLSSGDISLLSPVSIHAPVKGATCHRLRCTSRCRGFNPRAREGRDLREQLMADAGVEVSIHAPVKGATLPV